jgi:DUF1365 family protein
MGDLFDLTEEDFFDIKEVDLKYRIFLNLLNLAQLEELNERIKSFNYKIHNSLVIRKDRFKL